MTCDLTSFFTVFHSYLDNERVITKTVCNGTLFMFGKISASGGAQTLDC